MADKDVKGIAYYKRKLRRKRLLKLYGSIAGLVLVAGLLIFGLVKVITGSRSGGGEKGALPVQTSAEQKETKENAGGSEAEVTPKGTAADASTSPAGEGGQGQENPAGTGEGQQGEENPAGQSQDGQGEENPAGQSQDAQGEGNPAGQGEGGQGEENPAGGQPDTNEAGKEILYVTADALNARSGPSTDDVILGKVMRGEAVTRISEENGWSLIEFMGATAYVSSEHLSAEAPAPVETAAQPAASEPAAPAPAQNTGWGVLVPETNPAVSGGQWDLSTLSTDRVPFGYAVENRDANMIPTDWKFYENKWGRFNVDWIQDPSKNIIYLTMDEGFGNDETITILDTLKEKGVNVTFFLTEYFIDERPELVQRMVAEGHQLGNHTCTHRDMTTLTIEQQRAEIMTVQEKIKNLTGVESKVFRFPQGAYSEQCLGLVDNLGLKTVFWTNGYQDYDLTKMMTPEEMLAAVIRDLHPGAIYLLHARNQTNMQILGAFIDEARARGYEFGVYPLGPN